MWDFNPAEPQMGGNRQLCESSGVMGGNRQLCERSGVMGGNRQLCERSGVIGGNRQLCESSGMVGGKRQQGKSSDLFLAGRSKQWPYTGAPTHRPEKGKRRQQCGSWQLSSLVLLIALTLKGQIRLRGYATLDMRQYCWSTHSVRYQAV